MCHKFFNGFLALIIIVFSFWKISASFWIIIIAAGIIFLKQVFYLFKEGCDGMCFGMCRRRSELIMEKSKDKIEPSRKEVKQTLKKN